jgi:hypothetical protein
MTWFPGAKEEEAMVCSRKPPPLPQNKKSNVIPNESLEAGGMRNLPQIKSI